MKSALITGILGQDGPFLAKQLLEKGYYVYGMMRRYANPPMGNLDYLEITDNIELVSGDLLDECSLNNIVKGTQPTLIFNLASQSITEESCVPLLLCQKIEIRTFKELWEEISKKNKIKTTNINGIETEILEVRSKQVRALGYDNGMGTWKKIKQISRHKWNGKIVKLSQKFGSVEATPNHSILDTQNRVCKPEDNPWLLCVRKINYNNRKTTTPISINFGTNTKTLSTHEEIILAKILAGYISEGSASHNKANGGYVVTFANQDKNWLMAIANCIDQLFGCSYNYTTTKKQGHKDVYNLNFSSKNLYEMMISLCGKSSGGKKIPNFIYTAHRIVQNTFFEMLISGDGCYRKYKTKESISQYTTKSYRLACGLSLLYTIMGKDFTVHEELNKKYDCSYWHFLECTSYQYNQGAKGKKIAYVDYDGYVYDISVEDVNNFTVGVGNIVVHNSHVGDSFEQPRYTAEATGIGCLNLLEAIRKHSPSSRFYQASTSELMGKSGESGIQTEDTPFHPRSPYAIAKLFAHWSTINYRESYGMFTCCGILYNHECLEYNTPVTIKYKDGTVDIVQIGSIIPFIRKGATSQCFTDIDLEIWDGESWQPIKAITATRRNNTDDHQLVSIQARGGVVIGTAHHTGLKNDGTPIQFGKIQKNDKIKLGKYPDISSSYRCFTPELAELLGLLCADGYVSTDTIRFTNKDPDLLEQYRRLLGITFGLSFSEKNSISGFTGENIPYIESRDITIARYIREEIYTRDGYSKVPIAVINGCPEIRNAFLSGYYKGDGLKAIDADSFKTKSGVLAQGILYLFNREASVYIQKNEYNNKSNYYYFVNVKRMKAHHREKSQEEVRDVKALFTGSSEWVFDIETGSGKLMAGVGRCVVKNSCLRGKEFVTRKISMGVAKIKMGLAESISLGNIDAQRDWGHAPDFTRGMIAMLEADTPDDYILCTGQLHSVRDFLTIAFDRIGIKDWSKYVKIDPRFKRPAEVNRLLGSYAKAKEKLGWEPETSFEDLVRIMVDADIERLRK